MKVQSIVIFGQSGKSAHIDKDGFGKVTVKAGALADDSFPSHCLDDGITALTIARGIQKELDGFAGTRGDVVEYANVLALFV
jgi:hypothetical protein